MRAPCRVLGYARVSSAEQALGTSLQDQQDALHAYADARGLKVDRMYIEAESAVHEKIERREQIRLLVAAARAGDLILCDKIDRWSRDPEFTYRSVRELAARGVSMFFPGDQCDPGTPEGDTMLGFRVLFAREEHKRIKLRLVGTRKLLRERGYYVEGLPPWGYRRQDLKGPERNVLVIDEPQAERVAMAYTLCVAGRSLNEIAAQLDVSRDRLHTTLRSRVYLGEVQDGGGQWIRGRHPGIVDPQVFASAQDALDRRRLGDRKGRGESFTSTWWLRDLARCGVCGAKMSASYGGWPYQRRGYYVCFARCTRRGIAVLKVEERAEAILVARLEELREELATAKSPEPVSVDLEAIERRRRRIEQRRAVLLEQNLDGHITREQLRERMAALDLERTKVDAAAARPAPVSAGQLRTALRQVGAVRLAWDKATPLERRSVAAAFAREVRLVADRAPAFEWYTADELARRGT